MPGFEYGIKRAFTEVISGIVTSAIILAFLNSGILDPTFVFWFKLLNIVGIITLIIVMPLWGTTYLVGYGVGLWMLFNAGLVGIPELILYMGIIGITLVLRIKSMLES